MSVHHPRGQAIASKRAPHWYEFAYDGTTGAEIAGNLITLHFVDGLRGDDDLNGTNGTVVDIGAPSVAAVPPDRVMMAAVAGVLYSTRMTIRCSGLSKTTSYAPASGLDWRIKWQTSSRE